MPTATEETTTTTEATERQYATSKLTIDKHITIGGNAPTSDTFHPEGDYIVYALAHTDEDETPLLVIGMPHESGTGTTFSRVGSFDSSEAGTIFFRLLKDSFVEAITAEAVEAYGTKLGAESAGRAN